MSVISNDYSWSMAKALIGEKELPLIVYLFGLWGKKNSRWIDFNYMVMFMNFVYLHTQWRFHIHIVQVIYFDNIFLPILSGWGLVRCTFLHHIFNIYNIGENTFESWFCKYFFACVRNLTPTVFKKNEGAMHWKCNRLYDLCISPF